MYALSYVTQTTFEGICERLGCHNQSLSALKTQILALEEEAKEKGEKIFSLSNEVHNLRGRNDQLAGDIDLFQAWVDRVEEEHHAKVEETVKKAKISGALWPREASQYSTVSRVVRDRRR